jgi:hypothetical protein
MILVHTQEVTDSIGFLIFDLSRNNTQPIRWEHLPKNIQKIFLKTINMGIDKETARIRQKKDLYTFYYRDESDDFTACYVLYKEEVIFSYED